MGLYKGGLGQFSWILHRVTGVAVLLFLVTHIIDTALIMFGPDLYNTVMGFYRHPLFALAEMILFAAVLFHALNGVRIILIDFWPALTVHHKVIFKVMMVIFFAVYIPVVGIMIKHVIDHGGAH